MLFSTLTPGVSIHLITSAANLTKSMPLSWELMFVFCALSLSPHFSFSPVQCNLFFSPHKRKETSALAPSTGTHTLRKIKDRGKEIERSHMLMY